MGYNNIIGTVYIEIGIKVKPEDISKISIKLDLVVYYAM